MDSMTLVVVSSTVNAIAVAGNNVAVGRREEVRIQRAMVTDGSVAATGSSMVGNVTPGMIEVPNKGEIEHAQQRLVVHAQHVEVVLAAPQGSATLNRNNLGVTLRPRLHPRPLVHLLAPRSDRKLLTMPPTV
jgi:hypothetical protein